MYIAAADPTPFRRPRYIRWPSVCDTSRVNWALPDADPPPLPETQSHVEYVGCHPPSDDPHIRQATRTSSIVASSPLASSSTTVAIAAPSSEISPPNADLLTTSVVLAGAGIDPPQPPKIRSAADKPPPQDAKKTGRPPLFDLHKRREFCAMVRAGSSLRNAAKLTGVKLASVIYACRTDPKFAELLRAAERERNMLGIDRVFHAGEKYWRATAWMLERADPQQFSLSALRRLYRSPHLSPRRLEQLVAKVVEKALARDRQMKARQPVADAGLAAIDRRLAEIEAENNRPYDPDNDRYDWTEDDHLNDRGWDDGDDPQADDQAPRADANGNGQPPPDNANGDSQTARHDDDEAVAEEALRNLRRLMGRW